MKKTNNKRMSATTITLWLCPVIIILGILNDSNNQMSSALDTALLPQRQALQEQRTISCLNNIAKADNEIIIPLVCEDTEHPLPHSCGDLHTFGVFSNVTLDGYDTQHWVTEPCTPDKYEYHWYHLGNHLGNNSSEWSNSTEFRHDLLFECPNEPEAHLETVHHPFSNYEKEACVQPLPSWKEVQQ
jgi:hypothetical protein